jgi:hypothetical protein
MKKRKGERKKGNNPRVLTCCYTWSTIRVIPIETETKNQIVWFPVLSQRSEHQLLQLRSFTELLE